MTNKKVTNFFCFLCRNLFSWKPSSKEAAAAPCPTASWKLFHRGSATPQASPSKDAAAVEPSSDSASAAAAEASSVRPIIRSKLFGNMSLYYFRFKLFQHRNLDSFPNFGKVHFDF